MDSRLSDPEKTTTKLHVNWGHPSNHRSRRVLVDFNGESTGCVDFADEVAMQRGVRCAYDMAPHIPIAGTSSSYAFSAKFQVHLLFLGTAIALRAMDASSELFLLSPALPGQAG